MRLRTTLLAALCVLTIGLSTANTATIWQGSTNNWTTASNWTNGLPSTPQTADYNANQPGNGGPLVLNIDLPGVTARNTQAMTFGLSAGGSGFTFSGSGTGASATPGFQIHNTGTANTLTNNDDNTQTFNVPMRMHGNGGASPATAHTWTAAAGDLVFTGIYNHATNATINNNGGTLTIAGAFNTTVGNPTGRGDIIGGGGLTKTGAGILTLGGTLANSYTGVTTINAGTVVLNKTAGVTAIPANVTVGDATATDILRLDANHQIADTSIVTIGNGGRFNLNGRTETVASVVSAAASTAAEVQFGAGQLTIAPTALGQYYGTMTGAAGSTFIKEGTAEFRASAASQTFGFEKLVLKSGLYSIGHSTTLGQDTQLGAVPGSPLANAITFEGGTLRSLGGTASDTITLNVNRGVTVNAGGGTLDTNGANIVIPGKITGAGGLTKVSGLALTLSGDNDYAGGTTLNAGTLRVDNTSGSGTGTGAVGVTAGTLTGTGTIGGNVNMTAGTLTGTLTVGGTVSTGNATVAPGFAGPGVLSAGNMNFASGSIYSAQIGGLTAGTDYDQVAVTANAALNGTLNLSLINAFDPSPGDTFTLLTTGLNGRTGTFNVNYPVAEPNHEWAIDYNSDSVVLKYLLSTLPPDLQNYSINPVDAGDVLAEDLVTAMQVSGDPATWSPLSLSPGFFQYFPAYGGSGANGTEANASLDSAGQFSWNTLGSARGIYQWKVTATNGGGSDDALLEIHVTTVPEPATFTLVGLTLAGVVLSARRRND